MTTKVFGSVLLVFWLAVPSIAWNEPDTFRGVPWRASEEVLKSHVPGTCHAPLASSSGLLGDRACSSSFTIGDVPVKALLWLRGGGFVGVTFSFDPKRFPTIEGAFKERYGDPTGTKEEPSRTKGGLEFVNVEYEWQGAKVCISLRKCAGKITESRATLQTVAERERASSGSSRARRRARGTCRA